MQAEPFQAGTQSQCSMCQQPFVVPASALPTAQPIDPKLGGSQVPDSGSGTLRTPITGIAEGPATVPAPATPAPASVAESPDSLPVIDTKGSHPGKKTRKAPPKAFHVEDPETLHIPCSKCGKILEVPVEMLHQDVVCPFCESPFCLHLRDSVEYKEKAKRSRELKERKTSRAWLYWSIAAAVAVLLFLVFLILSSLGDS